MNNKIPFIIGASTLALLSLIIIQVKWMDQSRDLIEAQFDQKVNMALCMAVSEFAACDGSIDVIQSCQPSVVQAKSCCEDQLSSFISSDNIQTEVTKALSFYNINMPYVMEVNDKSQIDGKLALSKNDKPVYSCSLDPLIDTENIELSINFPGKQAYVLKQMGLMLVLSIIIMLFITGIFIYANYYLLKQKRLSEKNKEFFNHMAHEFKTPLTNIGLAAKMLKRKADDPLLSIITDENEQLNEQVNRVLSMASVEAGQFEIRKEKVNLKSLVNSIIHSIDIQIKDKKGQIWITGIDDSIFVMADAFHLSNALRNVLENAIKYNENRPLIELKGKEIDNQIIISIQDNGIGIEKQNHALVFDKFFRIQNPNSYQNKGFGLGLSYVKKIINLHNGDITVISEWQKGTRFDLKLPKVSA